MKCNSYYIPTNDNILIGFAGPPSSGKDTLAEALSLHLRNSSSKVQECAREYMEKYGPLYDVFQQHVIYFKQETREQEILRAYQVAISSSPKFLAWFYAVLLLKPEPTESEYGVITDLYLEAVKSIKDYHFIFFCDSLLSYEQDSIRYQDNKQVDAISRSIRSFLDLHGANYCYLPADTLGKRLDLVLDYIGAIPVEEK
jgi:hypothetical protein